MALKSAVIGAGFISQEHLKFLQNSDIASSVGVCDLSLAAANYAATHFNAGKAFTNYQSMLDEVKPDVVHVLTPPHTHRKIAADCLQSGTHVICEKPITSTREEFHELWEIAKACDRQIIENQNYRLNEPILKIKELVQKGVLGEVCEVEVRLALDIRSGGRFADPNLPSPVHKLPAGAIHDFLPHLCYLVLDYLPSIDRVSAAWSNHGNDDLFKFDDLDAIVLSKNIHARIRFSAYTQPDCFYFCVRGSKGYAETDLFQPYLRCVTPRPVGKQLTPLANHFLTGLEFTTASVRNFRRKVMQRTSYEGLHNLLNNTYQALSQGTPVPIQFEDMEKTVCLTETLLDKKHRF